MGWPGLRRVYDTEDEALAALSQPRYLGDKLVAIRSDGGLWVYADQERADLDVDGSGSHAFICAPDDDDDY